MAFIDPAERLEGADLGNGWVVQRRAPRGPEQTGGRFSVTYIVANAECGERAFLKALSFRAADSEPPESRPMVLEALLRAFRHERGVLGKCTDHHMRRVTTPMFDGQVQVAGAQPPLDYAYYLVFPLADSDLRSCAVDLIRFDLAFALRSLHHVATGIHELHQHGIAHQDIKPSNVLYLGRSGSKVTDLGRCHDAAAAIDHDGQAIPGDHAYAPLEMYYTAVPPHGLAARKAIDLYCLGSLFFSYFCGYSVTQGVLARAVAMGAPLRTDDFAANLPYFVAAFGELKEELAEAVGEYTRTLLPGILSVAEELCNPDPTRRGSPTLHAVDAPMQTPAMRYVSRFNALARRAELDMT